MNWFQRAARAPARAGQAPALAAEAASDQRVPGGPRHVAIIMDGNGRWAEQRRLPRVAGHRAGVEAVRRVVRAAPEIGIDALTLYAFSSENWRRPADEVSDLMSLLRHHLVSELDELHANAARIHLIGDWRRLRPEIVERLEHAVAVTRHNSRLQLVVALNYGGRDELVRAARALARGAAEGHLDPDRIDEGMLDSALDTAALPPVDLIVRTSGEQRMSNFLLWQAAYAELLFVPTLWPDFDAARLREAAEAFARRERRYGGR